MNFNSVVSLCTNGPPPFMKAVVDTLAAGKHQHFKKIKYLMDRHDVPPDKAFEMLCCEHKHSKHVVQKTLTQIRNNATSVRKEFEFLPVDIRVLMLDIYYEKIRFVAELQDRLTQMELSN